MKSRTMDFPTVSLLLLLAGGLCHSQVITPVGVTATSSLDANRDISHTISGAGLSGGGTPILDQTHSNNVNGTYWLGAFAGGQVLTFDLGGANDVQFIHIWQYWRDNAAWANRAIQSFDIAYSTDGGSNYSTPVAGPVGLTLGTAATPVQTLDLGSVQSGVTHVQFTNLQNFGATDFFGLAEIRFGGPGTGPAIELGDPEVTVLDYDQAEATSFLSGEDASGVTLYWGTVDQGESQTGWDDSASLGAQTAGGAIPDPAALMASLTQGTTYHCRFYAESASSSATAWSNAASFTTPNALQLTNPQASNVAYDQADVTVTSNRDADTTQLYWGESDPGATATGWDNGPVSLGAQSAGTFPAETLSGLTENTTYYFRYFCESSSPVASTAWSEAGTFTTPNALELTAPAATNVVFNQADVAVTSNFDTVSMDLYWGTSDPGATTTGWDNGPVNLGAQTAGTIPAETLTGLTELTPYFFRFVATSSSPVASTAWSDAGTFSTPSENPSAVITPSAVTATDSLGSYPIENTINSSGLTSSPPSVAGWTHVATPTNSNDFSWLGTRAGTEIIYQLPSASSLDYLFFWPYWGGVAARSLTAFDISFSSDGVTYSTPSTITLGAPGSATEVFDLGTQTNVTHVKFDNLQNGGDVYAGIGEVRFGGDTTTPGDPYGTWAAGPWSGTLSDDSSELDFDGGGLETGIEWVVGGDPTDGSDDPGNTPIYNTSDPSNFIFTFKRRDAAAADANTDIAVEYGSNLSGWAEAVHGTDGVTIDDSTDLGGGFHEVTVSIPRTLAVDGKLFARLKVTVTP
ncbi:hypothetical protein [Haloferula sp. A504]|uniref:hypothetical protein n=1 Tax=Haloferula sp. A504 TaxID=3373601 RepID=UPI0031C6A226|nr:hypothetical protein [Verrucomicrobiaceae bacterium E54]